MSKKLLVGVLLLSTLTMKANDSGCNRLTKKDKQDLVTVFTELKTPMKRIELSIDQLSQVAQQIQNYITDFGHHEHHHGQKECCKELLAHLAQIKLRLAELVALMVEQRTVLGSLDDQSVGEQDFNSVQDIDNAELSAITWLKTIYREQLKDKFVS